MCLKNAKPWSITVRLIFLSVLSASVILVSLGWYMYQTLADTLVTDDRQFLIKEVQLLETVLQTQSLDLQHLADEQSEGLNLPLGRYYSRILDDSGHSLSESPGMALLPKAMEFSSAAASTSMKIADGRTFMLMAVSNRQGYQTQIALDISHQAELLAKYQRNLLGGLGLGLLFSTLAAFFIAKRGLKPLVDMTYHVESVTAMQLHEQLDPAEWPKELSTLAFAFNAMLSRLAASFSQLTRFSADLAHELRNPINNLMGETEVMLARPRNAEEYREILESNLEEYARLSRIVETLLFLARAESTEIPLRTVRLDGGAELEAVCSYHEAQAAEKNIRLVRRGQADLDSDAQLFKRVLSNLLLNAIQYTPADGEIILLLQATAAGVEVSVQDTGCGIAAAHLPKLFDRFYQVDPARSAAGTGLGLSIVKSILDLHGG